MGGPGVFVDVFFYCFVLFFSPALVYVTWGDEREDHGRGKRDGGRCDMGSALFCGANGGFGLPSACTQALDRSRQHERRV